MSYREMLKNKIDFDVSSVLLSWEKSDKKYDDFIKHYNALFDLIHAVNIVRNTKIIPYIFRGIIYFIVFFIIFINILPYEFGRDGTNFLLAIALSAPFTYLYFRNKFNDDNDAIIEYVAVIQQQLSNLQNEFLKIQEKRINKLEQFASEKINRNLFNNCKEEYD